MRELVRGYATCCLESADANGRLAAAITDIVELSRALDRSAPLREALTGPEVGSSTRWAIVSDLVGPRSTPEGTALLAFTASSERPGELAPALAGLVAEGEARLEGSRAGAPGTARGPTVPLSSRSALRERVAGYAERVLEELPGAAAVDVVEDELFALARLMQSEKELRRIVGDPTLAYAGRFAVLDDLVGNLVHAATLRLVSFVIGAPRLRDLVGTLDWLVELAAAEQGRRVGEVRSAVALGDPERDRLGAALGRLVRRKVEVRVVEDPTVLGGLVVSIGDLVIDGSVKLRLERLGDLLGQPV